MAQSDLSKLLKVNAFIFDVDGVFTNGSIVVNESGEMLRTMNIKDGYAVQLAVKKKYHIIIISGGTSKGVVRRFEKLGVTEIHIGIEDKQGIIASIMNKLNLSKQQCLYMGDDIPDLDAMQACEIKTCPNDAVWQIKEIADIVNADAYKISLPTSQPKFSTNFVTTTIVQLSFAIVCWQRQFDIGIFPHMYFLASVWFGAFIFGHSGFYDCYVLPMCLMRL